MLGKILVLVLVCVTLAVAQVIPGQYIVTLNADADLYHHLSKVNKTLKSEDSILYIYGKTLKGYAGKFSDKVIAHIKGQKEVSHIEEDQVASVTQTATQTSAPWGLARISLNRALSDGPVVNTYTYPSSAGSGITVFVIDTGIYAAHNDFNGRVSTTSYYNAISDETWQDCNGHGTHVASSAIGEEYGVAKSATAVSVKVLSCQGSGSNAGVIAGVDWVGTQGKKNKCVVNMSLGGGASRPLDDAVTSLVNDGCVVVVAAGNDDANACYSSPARAGAAVTVGATASTDARSTFSNYGTCVDIFAPGTGIVGAWYNGPDSKNTISGTSMASPHVAGIAAVQLAANPSLDSASVVTWITSQATRGAVTNPETGSPNLLAFSPY